MSKEILIKIRDKIADRISGEYVCGNSDFVAVFDFDEEWSAYETKTARFYYGDNYIDKPFNGDRCEIPILSDIHSFEVGVFAGNLKTSTSAYVPARKSILCKGGSPAAPSPDVYAEIMEMLNEAKFPPEEIAAAVKKYIDENGIDLGDEYTDATAQYNEYLNSGGTHTNFFPTLGDGKYCVDDGFRVYRCKNIEYCGCLYSTVKTYGDDQIFTEELFIDGVKVYEMESSPTEYPHTALRIIGDPFDDNDAVNKKYVVNSIPKALPNPHALTFTGAASGSYDGSKPLTVDIPQGGGSDKWEFIGEFTLPEDSIEWWVTEDADGNPIELKEALIILTAQPATLNSGITNLYFGNPAVAKPFNTNCYFATANCLRNVKSVARVLAKYIPNWTTNSGAVLSAQDTSSVVWGFGDDIAGGTVNKKCLAGVAMKSAKPTTDLIGANSNLVLWGVRM